MARISSIGVPLELLIYVTIITFCKYKFLGSSFQCLYMYEHGSKVIRGKREDGFCLSLACLVNDSLFQFGCLDFLFLAKNIQCGWRIYPELIIVFSPVVSYAFK